MHTEARNWVKSWASAYGGAVKRVLEIGAQDINGSPRGIFPGEPAWVGVDVFDRPGVDWVGLAHEYPLKGWDRESLFDVFVSTEALEHDPHWRLTLIACASLVRPGGLLLLTCAAGNRAPHGVQEDTPTPGYYENRSAEDVRAVLEPLGFSGRYHIDRGGMDLYVAVTRTDDQGVCVASLPLAAEWIPDAVRRLLGG